ncbi:TDT family transporter [Thermotalea metallivorans]|uniref:Potassium-tellurite ethidium and proflavin transporter n=1 Tax=Thermotalea metallivorans TaxID=520762 RepID=A0A140LEK9_9FIRM|nr:TDT family transporter [Thermotalea metallivorans]KXG78984.1 hypothetical protein AN619_01440 [Thermotalea metallivorans]
MNSVIKKVPIPIAGLILALAAAGNLVFSYGSLYKNIFGTLSAFLLILLVIKIWVMPKSLGEGFDNPVIASVMPTFFMGLMILSTYIKVHFPLAAYGLWLLALIMHGVFMIYFTKKYILNFHIQKVFPSYFIVYVGIVCGSVTAPAFGLANVGQLIFWFGLGAYFLLLPLVIYRVLVMKEIPEPAIPTITIFAAPASLCLAGYLNSFQEKSMGMIMLLSILSLFMFISVMLYIPKMLKLKFYPSYSAFTFPFVITAIAMKGTAAFLANAGKTSPFLGYFIKFLELWAILMVLYVLIRYMAFMLSNPAPVGSIKKDAHSS